MINREAFERARRETDFVAELALGLKELSDEIERCVDGKDLDGIKKTRGKLDALRYKVRTIAEKSPPEFRNRWRETIALRLQAFDDWASRIEKWASIGDWESAYGGHMELEGIVVAQAMEDMDEALVQRYLELAGTPPPHGSATSRQIEAVSNEGILKCRYCGAPYAYRENLELHERGCPNRDEVGLKREIQNIIDQYAPEVKVTKIEDTTVWLSHPVYYKVQEKYLDRIRSLMDATYGKGNWSLEFEKE